MLRVIKHSFGTTAMLLLLASLACGTNPRTYPVKGKVVFSDGKPVTWGRVECLSEVGNVNASGEIASDGSFELETFGDRDGAVPGRHQVTVVQFTSAALNDPRRPHTNVHAEPLRFVSRKYANYESSGLVFDVAGDTTLLLTVSSQ